MDVYMLKSYIYENGYVEQILESINCHHIVYHALNEYWTCANPDGDNKSAIVVYNNENLNCIDYTRNLVQSNRSTDLLDLIMFFKGYTFPKTLAFISNEIGISYYHDFEEDIPESFKFLDMIESMCSESDDYEEKESVLKPIPETILSYYYPYVNDLFCEDNIDYETQKDFEIGFDGQTNRYTIPIRSEIGDLVGVKGRYFYREVPEGENKYMYLEPCSKSQLLFGLNKTIEYIRKTNVIYVVESEKGVMQLWTYGYKNAVASGGKLLSKTQINLLVRTGAKIILCFDKDVDKNELEDIAYKFPDGIDIYYIYDEDDILLEHESPSDDPCKWQQLVENNVYKLK